MHVRLISVLHFKRPPKFKSKLGHICSVMIHRYLDYMVLLPKGCWNEFSDIFQTVNPSGKCNCELCSAQLRVKMRSAWEAVQLGTFTYITGCIFNARKGLIGSTRHESLKYQNWCWEQSFPVKTELIYFCRKIPREKYIPICPEIGKQVDCLYTTARS